MKTPLYYQVIDAFNVEIAKRIDHLPTRDAAAKLCEAVFIAALIDPYWYHPSEVIELIAESSRSGYACWISCAERAMADADLSFLPDPEDSKMKLQAAMVMAEAWMFHLNRLRKGDALPPILEED